MAAAPAAAGTGCASGYVCYFDDHFNSTLREQADGGDNWSFEGENWRRYNSDGTWYGLPGTNVDNSIEAANIQWNIDDAYFFTANGYAGSVVERYLVGDRGFRNWYGNDRNVASSLEAR
ncbi:hypothetical protein IM660_15900 [Ruania alkalisoli]|uniref:Peptidase inhibitor family I36 n=1 Tax=Ruania alkalisoli TaxID=2779775 RepID=A0A7M1SRI7_9MICO|nr:hypothetical protein [Ruania alkalisoli]QOR70095.1 hypothetical protein IM660_15900 [Ruania alkalisoli]